jgi:excisionase family DNA binding protein
MNNDYHAEDWLSRLSISVTEEAAIKKRADRVGKQIGEAVSSFLAEIMISILATRPQAAIPAPRAAFPIPPAAPSKPPVPSPKPQQAAPREPDGILKGSDVAQILRISKAKAYRMMKEGEIPAIQFGRTTRVRRQDLEEFIRTHVK